MEKSIILPWSKENIEKVPEKCGVLMLRSTPVNGDIVAMAVTENLKKEFLKFLDTGTKEEVKYFDWYLTDSILAAEEAKKELLKKFHLEGILE